MKYLFILLTVTLFPLWQLNAQSARPLQKNKSIALVSFGRTDSARAFENREKSPSCQIEDRIVYAAGNDRQSSWLNTQLKSLLDIDSTDSFEKGIARKQEAYIQEYRRTLEEEDSTMDSGFYMSMNYMQFTKLDIIRNRPGVVIASLSGYDYSGGAHGNSATSYYCFDMENRKRMKIEDILNINPKNLQKLLEKYFRKERDISVGEPIAPPLFEDKLLPNDNFYFTDKALIFVYNPYEVAPYAEGEICVSLPFTVLHPYLTQSFRRLTTLRQRH